MTMYTIAQLKKALREGPYAWPGGYPTYFVDATGDAISHEGVRQTFRTIIEDMRDRANGQHPGGGRAIEAQDINYEDPDLFCAVTGKRIPSAYAEDKAEDQSTKP